ncbi:hypothetical protein CH373_09705 [Leptospira perolatii]|uniref:Lipoprotein n=1 Tax=Leptospira perolatii TaxID=2023191 RepID=A0A2M9ZMN7_9LEPT|nr:TIGR04452 family lipoprotein [Leptospira perolatii]PJZ70063.1 hypothetical protein CH360_07450 [Leptospira perolatii]PJZ73251.1 hypothetical protein CH373_09705 [Leptospira perolatii]
MKRMKLFLTGLLILLFVATLNCIMMSNLGLGKKQILSGEAAANLDIAILTGLIVLPSGTQLTGNFAVLSSLPSIAGIDSKDVTAYYEEEKVKACAKQITTVLAVTADMNAAVFVAASCKLEKSKGY